ncbi:hypothetical protein [Kitasatospora sp. NRRL B-11411]|uniref:hypothetical protein n=1 Tax=Kitasatospora sp. NRRL B-11411 TaxID=1463822 RepID=UPI000AA36A98|nr:hypothetical protein [Kitasatospora sp. NRRL B-11411]
MMHPVEYYPHGLPGLDWHAVSDDLDGLVLAASRHGVAIARATDPRKVLVVDPDEWADLRHAIKRGDCDHLLGDRLLCADPTPRPDPRPVPCHGPCPGSDPGMDSGSGRGSAAAPSYDCSEPDSGVTKPDS